MEFRRVLFRSWTGGGQKKAQDQTAADMGLTQTDPIYAGYPSILFQNVGGSTTPPPTNGGGNGGDGGDGGDGGGDGTTPPAHPVFPIVLDPTTGKYFNLRSNREMPEGAQAALINNPNAQNPPPAGW